VRLLLDTHTFIRWDNDRLPKPVTRRIQRATEVFVSAVTAWEIAIKCSLGRLAAKGNVAEALEDYGFQPLAISLSHADCVRTLPPLHRDPFDRMLVAQASIEGLSIVSADEALSAYAIPVVWA
jgi:PIN domain nuclease of toxin-antitoxin system